MTSITVEQRPDGVRFHVRVQPRASRNEITGALGGALKVRLQAPPVDGAANDALIAFLAEALGVPKRGVRIVAGLSSRAKLIEVDGIATSAVNHLATG